MEAQYNEEKFKQHIRTVVSQAEGGDTLEERPLTFEELKELAISMGMSEEEWEALQKKAYVHLESAQDHLKARNFNEAISQAEKATAINPYIQNGNGVLAKAYQMLWLEDDSTSARNKAEYHARKELLTDPKDIIAINVLSTINKKKKLGGSEAASKKKYLIIGAAVLGLFVLIFLYFSMSNSNAVSSDLENKLIIAQEEVSAKYDLVQIAIDQRNSMIPDLFGAVDNSHSDLNKLNNEINNLTAELNQADTDDKFKLEKQLDEKIAAAKKLINAYGDKESVSTLMVQIEGAENRIGFEKKSYNDAVKSYNILVKQSKNALPGYEIQPYYSEN